MTRKQKYQPEKTKARKLVARAIKRGELDHPTNCLCWVCGIGRWENPEIEIFYHHVNYSLPLEVFPMCHTCHIRWHIAMEPWM